MGKLLQYSPGSYRYQHTSAEEQPDTEPPATEQIGKSVDSLATVLGALTDPAAKEGPVPAHALGYLWNAGELLLFSYEAADVGETIAYQQSKGPDGRPRPPRDHVLRDFKALEELYGVIHVRNADQVIDAHTYDTRDDYARSLLDSYREHTHPIGK